MQLASLFVGSAIALTVSAQPTFAAFLAPGEVVTWQHYNGGIVHVDGEPIPFGGSFELGIGNTLAIGAGYTELSIIDLPNSEAIEFDIELLANDSHSAIAGPNDFHLSIDAGEGISTQAALGNDDFTSVVYGHREGFARVIVTPATEPVPEPATILGSLVALGVGVVLKRQSR
ncbi:MAG: PEP-CTERM sorting domain-containing protein [Cyanobacteria bacterium J06626_18]